MERGEYIRLLNEPMVRNLKPSEINTAVELAHRYSERTVLDAWKRWLITNPGGYMRDFRPWFETEVQTYQEQPSTPTVSTPRDPFAQVRMIWEGRQGGAPS